MPHLYLLSLRKNGVIRRCVEETARTDETLSRAILRDLIDRSSGEALVAVHSIDLAAGVSEDVTERVAMLVREDIQARLDNCSCFEDFEDSIDSDKHAHDFVFAALGSAYSIESGCWSERQERFAQLRRDLIASVALEAAE